MIKFKTIHRDSYDDQSDFSLLALDENGKVLGRIDYSDYHDQPSVQMIFVNPDIRRQKIGTELAKQLQREYPNVEIGWGSSTESGSALIKSLPTTYVPNEEYKKLSDKLKVYSDEYNKLKIVLDRWHEMTDTKKQDKLRSKIHKFGQRMNDLDNEMWTINSRLDSLKPGKTIIKT